MTKYRIIQTPYGTYEVHKKGWFFWRKACRDSTYSLDTAEERLHRIMNPVVLEFTK